MDDKNKIAQIIAKRLCPSRNSHFQLYGYNATCYSRMNFAECTAIADTVDALIAAGIGDVSEWKEKYDKEKDRADRWKQCAKNWEESFKQDEQIESAEFNRLTAERDEYKHRAEVAENKLFDLAMFCTKGNRNFHGKSESEHEEEARKLFNEWLKQSEQELQEERK